MPALEGLSASGGSHADVVMDASSASMLVEPSGGSSLSGTITTGALEIRSSGGSTARVEGGSHILYHGEGRVRSQELSGGSWIRS